MKRETRFFREDMVKEIIQKLSDRQTEKLADFHVKTMREQFNQVYVLLCYLILDLELSPHIQGYIDEMEDGYAKEVAQIAFEVAGEIPVPTDII